METNEFYKKILSIKIPLFMFAFGVWFILYSFFVCHEDLLYLIHFVYVYISIIIITELIIAYLRIRKILKQCKDVYAKKIKFNLLVLPYLPAILGTTFYSISRIIEYGVLYKREFITTLGITLFVNFFFSSIYNIKIKTFKHIENNPY
ncbi:MAG: hypothetical protein K6E51_05240 [Treponema sp.]|nr:hypothetical protein [Treponema sp.]